MDLGSDILESGKGGIITARGTGDGLIIRLDGRVERESLIGAVQDFMNSRKAFLTGNEVSLEWVGVIPDSEIVDKLSDNLRLDFNIKVKGSRLKGSAEEGDNLDIKGEDLDSDELSGLFSGIDDLVTPTGSGLKFQENAAPTMTGGREFQTAGLWDEADTRLVFATLRSGQKIETEHSLVVIGDVNPGAELVAGGDIVVLGTLRGIAHAGAYDESGAGRTIFALNLHPTQLRIGMVISRGYPNPRKGPEIARVEGDLIVVEEFSSKSGWVARRGS